MPEFNVCDLYDQPEHDHAENGDQHVDDDDGERDQIPVGNEEIGDEIRDPEKEAAPQDREGHTDGIGGARVTDDPCIGPCNDKAQRPDKKDVKNSSTTSLIFN